MKLFSGPDQTWRDGEDARAVAGQLGIPHHILDLSASFCARVMDPFAAAYEAGCTPNPCVTCNRYVKFGALLDRALELGCEKLATGHYARVEYDAGSGRFLLKKALHRRRIRAMCSPASPRSSSPDPAPPGRPVQGGDPGLGPQPGAGHRP